MASLKDWFDKKDYEEGLILLAQNSKNRMLIQNLGKKKNPAKLKYELEKIARIQMIEVANKEKELARKAQAEKGNKKKSQDKPAGKHKKPAAIDNIHPDDLQKLQVIKDGKALDIDKLPGKLKKLWIQNRDSYKEIRSLHEKLKLMENATDEDRKPLTERVTQLDDQIRDNWAVIDAWDPSKDDEGKNEKIDHKRINANRKFISINLKKLQDGIEESKAEIIRDNLKLRYEELMKAGEEVEEKTIAELKKFSII